MTTITVKDLTRGEIVAQGEQDRGAILLEGCYYFDSGFVSMDHLLLTERTYTCPYKGTCQWIDLETATGTIQNVAWVYTRPDEKYEFIRDKIGFAYGMRPGIMVEKA